MTHAWEKHVRRIAIGSDHAGVELKEKIKAHLEGRGIEAIDFGTNSTESTDYPDYAQKVASLVSQGRLGEGILICGTGIGMSITANKFPNVRAAVVTNEFTAKSSRAHNDANVLCLGSRVLSDSEALKILDLWLDEPFEAGRHAKRLDKIKQLDRGIVPPLVDV